MLKINQQAKIRPICVRHKTHSSRDYLFVCKVLHLTPERIAHAKKCIKQFAASECTNERSINKNLAQKNLKPKNYFQVDQLLLGPTYATPKVLELAGLTMVTFFFFEGLPPKRNG
jgi:hypothetical protein